MKMKQSVVYISIGAVLAGVLAIVGVGVAADEKGDERSAAKQSISSREAVMSLVVTRKGDVIVVDSSGNPVSPCRLPTGKDESQKETKNVQGGLPICKSTTGTTITEVIPISVVRHTGSTCFTSTTFRSGALTQTTVCY